MNQCQRIHSNLMNEQFLFWLGCTALSFARSTRSSGIRLMKSQKYFHWLPFVLWVLHYPLLWPSMDFTLMDIHCPCFYLKQSPTLSICAHHHEALDNVETLVIISVAAAITASTVSNYDLYCTVLYSMRWGEVREISNFYCILCNSNLEVSITWLQYVFEKKYL